MEASPPKWVFATHSRRLNLRGQIELFSPVLLSSEKEKAEQCVS